VPQTRLIIPTIGCAPDRRTIKSRTPPALQSRLKAVALLNFFLKLRHLATRISRISS